MALTLAIFLCDFTSLHTTNRLHTSYLLLILSRKSLPVRKCGDGKCDPAVAVEEGADVGGHTLATTTRSVGLGVVPL